MKKRLLILFLFYTHGLVVLGQGDTLTAPLGLAFRPDAPPDSLAAFPVKMYRKATRFSQFLYNGARYHIYDRKAETHQFFRSRELIKGYLRYENRDYGPLLMHYDTNLGLIVVEQPRHKYLVQLQPELTQAFLLENDSFIRIDTGFALKKGFYQLLYSGPTTVLCARKKERLERLVNQAVEVEFLEKDRFFLYFGGGWHEITGRKRLLTVLAAHKSRIKKHFKNNLIRFKQDKERAIVSAVELYDRLQKTL